MVKKYIISYDELHKILHYDPETGIFTWKKSKRQGWTGKRAGFLHKSTGYIHIKIKTQNFGAHRLAWLYVYGYLPEYQIDHIDQIRHHNWIKNLREVTNTCNQQNCKLDVNNKSGITGVYWRKDHQKWQAYITKNYKMIHLGFYDSIYDAAVIRYKAEQKYFNCVVKSSAQKYIETYNN